MIKTDLQRFYEFTQAFKGKPIPPQNTTYKDKDLVGTPTLWVFILGGISILTLIILMFNLFIGASS